MSDGILGVDDLVTGRAAEQLGEGVIPIRAILVVETMTDASPSGLRYVLSDGLALPHAMGLLRSVTLKLEADDLAMWEEE